MMDNNFNTIRLLAALLVLVSHSYALTGAGTAEPFAKHIGYLTGGGLAVDAFFFISGYLVTISAGHRTLFFFLKARALRILPGLFGAVLFGVIVGAACTSLPAEAYWTNPYTRGYFGNIFLFDMRFGLPGVFEALPDKGVNGSLWTLPLEATMYFASAALLVARVRSAWIFAVIALALGLAYFIGVKWFALSWANRGPLILPSVLLHDFLKLGFFFFAGAALSKARPKPNGLVAGCLLAAFMASAYVPFGPAIYYAALPYLVYYAAFAPTRLDITPGVDLSYGVYLYAFPVQQSMVHTFGVGIGPIWLTLLVVPITCLLAALSWRFVERPALSLKAQALVKSPSAAPH